MQPFALILIILAPTLFANEAPPITISHLAKVLSGHWQGQAVQTPIGKVNYDMVYRKTKKGLQGKKKHGVPHIWSFYSQGGKIYLKFLSRFGGNTEALLFEPALLSPKKMVFYNLEKKTRVVLRFEKKTLHKLIYRHGKLHVEIRLNRG